MRRFRAETDEALAIYERLRRRLEERANRLELAGPDGENHLLPFGRTQYEAWLDGAREAKKEYQAGGISAEEFLRRIDIDGEMGSRKAARDTLPEPDRTPWRGPWDPQGSPHRNGRGDWHVRPLLFGSVLRR